MMEPTSSNRVCVFGVGIGQKRTHACPSHTEHLDVTRLECFFDVAAMAAVLPEIPRCSPIPAFEEDQLLMVLESCAMRVSGHPASHRNEEAMTDKE